MHQPVELTRMLKEFTAALVTALGDNLVGIYPRGSLALGDFSADQSDVDLLVATNNPISTTEFAALSDVHCDLRSEWPSFASRLEVAYLPRAALNRFIPGQDHPTLYFHRAGEPTFAWERHDANWVFERWTVREYARPVLGPPPRELIAEISANDLRDAARGRLRDWAGYADNLTDPEWLVRKHHAYAVETMCRALYTIAEGRLASKSAALRWAAPRLPRQWRILISKAETWRLDDGVDDQPESVVLAFIHWAALAGERAMASSTGVNPGR